MKLPPVAPSQGSQLPNSAKRPQEEATLSPKALLGVANKAPLLLSLLRLMPLLPMLNTQLANAPKEVRALIQQLYFSLPLSANQQTADAQHSTSPRTKTLNALSSLLNQLNTPDSALRQWLLKQPINIDDVHSTVRLVTEQQINIFRQPLDEPYLLFIWDEKSPTKVKISRKEDKTRRHREKQVWDIWLQLSIDNHWLDAHVIWQGNQAVIAGYSDSLDIAERFDRAKPIMEERLAQHGIQVADWQGALRTESTFDSPPSQGLSITV